MRCIQINCLIKWKKETIGALVKVLEDGRRKGDKEKETLKNKIQELYAEIGELTTKLNWLKKNLASNWTRAERTELVDFENRELPLTAQAELLSLNRSNLYYRPVPPSPLEIAIKHRIDRIYTEDPTWVLARLPRF